MIPSLLQIPSAVSDSKLHSVLPNNGKGDFTFDRSTGATRINRDGLIEEVGYFSSELVQNGNFSELGSELITNGDFATDSNWIKETGWSIANGKAIGTSTTGKLLSASSNVIQLGKTYLVEYEISDYVSGTVRIELNGNNDVGTTRSANGVYVEYITILGSASDLRVVFDGLQSFTGSIDNVSVKQVDPNNRFELNSASYGQNKVTLTSVGGAMTYIKQTGLNLEANKTYLIKINATKLSGDTNLALGSDGTNNVSGSPIISTSGFKRYYFTPASDISHIGIKRNFGGSGAVWEITSFSIVEVQGDRPRLSYDITNGVVEDKPHLLLEPSATNKLTFSNDFSQWTLQNVTLTENQIGVGGSTNATKLTSSGSNNDKIILSTATTGTNTVSIFAKAGSVNFIAIEYQGYAYFNLSTGAVANTGSAISTKMEDFGNGWYRCSLTVNISSSGTNAQVYVIATNGSTNTSVGDNVFVQYAQVEANSYATSYIPTAGTTITRAAETCNNSKPSVNSTEGVLYAEIQAFASDSTAKEITISDGTTNNRVIVSYNTANQIRINYRNSSTNIFDQSNSATITDFHKIAVKWKVNDFSFYLDGSEVASSTSGSVISANTLTTVNFDDGAGTFDFYGKVKGLAVYNEALSESQLMQLTGVTASSIYNNFVTRTASFTVEALNEVKKVIDNL